jgi:dihydrofolate reductase
MIIGIAAVDRKGAIGKGGKLPWHYSADMKFFRETTTGHAVVMGRKTWLTIGKPLKNRLNIVLSRDSSIEPQESLLVFSDIDSALSFSNSLTTDLFVIGGAQIYEAFLPHIEKWIITEVPLTVSGADAFMPKGYLDGFKVAESKSIGEDLVVKFYSR